MPSAGNTIQGKYRLLRRIGKGGMGVVFKAEKVTTKEEYAIKFMKRMFVDDEVLVERFKREFETLKAVRHPNVVNIYDWYFPPPRKDEFADEDKEAKKPKRTEKEDAKGKKEKGKALPGLVDGIAEPEQTTAELLSRLAEEEGETTTKKEAAHVQRDEATRHEFSTRAACRWCTVLLLLLRCAACLC